MILNREEQKQAEELEIFDVFSERSGLPVDRSTIESRRPPEPDIKCLVSGDGYVAFELKEICDEELAGWIADLYTNPPSIDADEAPFKYLRDFETSSNYFAEWLKGKFSDQNKYQTDCPMALLLYENGRTGLTNDIILADIEEHSEILIPIFRKVWFMGEEVCGCVIPNGIELDSNKKYRVSVKQEGKPGIFIPELFDNRKDAIRSGKEFAKAHPTLFPPEDGEVCYPWMAVDEGE